MINKYLIAGICVLIVGITINLFAGETAIKLNDGTSSSAFSVKDDSNNTLLHVQGDGNVGLGTTAPSVSPGTKVLHIQSTRPVLKVEGTGGGSLATIVLKNDASEWHLNMEGGIGNSLGFWNNGHHMIIQPSGNVGLGTTAPSVLPGTKVLHIQSTRPVLKVEGTGGGSLATIVLKNDASEWHLNMEGGIGNSLGFWNNGHHMIIQSSGNVGLGTTAPTEKLDVIGNIKASGTITPSDFRFKKNISTLNGALDKVQDLRGVSYDWRTDQFTKKGFSDKRSIGVIAQEVEKVVPEVVHTGSDGYKGVEYSKLVPLLIEAIKEQQETISALSQQVRALEDRI